MGRKWLEQNWTSQEVEGVLHKDDDQEIKSKQSKWKRRANPGSFPWKTEERPRPRWGDVSVQREEAVGCAFFPYNRKASHTAAKKLCATVGVEVKYPEEGWLYLNSVQSSLPRCLCTPLKERQVPFTWLAPASHTVSLHSSYLVQAEWVRSWVMVFCWLHMAVSKTPETQREVTKTFPQRPSVSLDRVCRKLIT